MFSKVRIFLDYSLRSKRFQSSYYAKVRAEAIKKKGGRGRVIKKVYDERRLKLWAVAAEFLVFLLYGFISSWNLVEMSTVICPEQFTPSAIKPGFHIIVQIVPIAPVVSKISRRSGRLRRLVVSIWSSRSPQRQEPRGRQRCLWVRQ